MSRLRGTLSSVIFATAFAFMLWLSHVALAQRGTCSNIGGSGAMDVRASAESALPVAVVQFCTGTTLAIILMACFAVAAIAWIGLVRYRAPLVTVIGSIALALACAATFPYVASTDPYAYAMYGYEAMGGAAQTPIAQLHQLFPSSSIDRKDNYGPLATMEYEALAFASKGSLRRFIIVERLANLVLVFVVSGCCIVLRAPGSSRVGAALAAFHPIVIVESIAFCHGDILMVTLLSLAFVAYRRSQVVLCCVLIVLAVEVRSVAGLAFLVLLAELSFTQRLRDMWRALTSSALAALATAAISMVLFGRFSVGGSPLGESWSAPMLMLAGTVFGGKSRARDRWCASGSHRAVRGFLLHSITTL